MTGADGQMINTEAVDDFRKMGLSEPLLKAVFEAKKFDKPSKIQSLAIPMIITPPFYNLVGQAKTVGVSLRCRFSVSVCTSVSPCEGSGPSPLASAVS